LLPLRFNLDARPRLHEPERQEPEQLKRRARGAEAPEQTRDEASRVVAVAVRDDVVEHVEREEEREQEARQERREFLLRRQPEEERERAEEYACAAPAER